MNETMERCPDCNYRTVRWTREHGREQCRARQQRGREIAQELRAARCKASDCFDYAELAVLSATIDALIQKLEGDT